MQGDRALFLSNTGARTLWERVKRKNTINCILNMKQSDLFFPLWMQEQTSQLHQAAQLLMCISAHSLCSFPCAVSFCWWTCSIIHKHIIGCVFCVFVRVFVILMILWEVLLCSYALCFHSTTHGVFTAFWNPAKFYSEHFSRYFFIILRDLGQSVNINCYIPVIPIFVALWCMISMMDIVD